MPESRPPDYAAKALTPAQIAELGRIDTPTICNLLEMVAPQRRGHGYTTRHLQCAFPDLPPMVGYAKTATIRAKEPGPLSGPDNLALRFGYYDYVVDGPAPRVSVIQDLDDHHPGYGSFWGEVNSNVHKALGCIGGITNGSIRDLPMLAEGFQLLAGSVGPSHAFVHLVSFDCEVNIHGMVVRSGDLVHADRHGAVVIPQDVADKLASALDLLMRQEAVIIEAARNPGFTVEKLKDAIRKSVSITY
ncbi:MAG TPA: RraA family protein [Dongiaceae bacterium]|nr:RraA family protein [Dongiaceae bacterium]